MGKGRGQQSHLPVAAHGGILVLPQKPHQALSVQKLAFCGVVQIAGELGKDFHFPVLGQIQPQRTGRAFHSLGLGVAAHTGYRKAHIHRRTLAGEEQPAFQINLSVRDGNDVGRDIRRHVPRLGFDNGKRGQTAAAQFVAQMGGAFQQTGVQIEHVAGERFTSGGTFQQKAQGTVGNGVFAQVIVDNQHIPAHIHKVFGKSGSGVGGDILF